MKRAFAYGHRRPRGQWVIRALDALLEIVGRAGWVQV